MFAEIMFSKSLLLFLLLPVFAVLLKIGVTFFEKRRRQSISYLKKDSVLTDSERAFYIVLKNIVGDDFLILSQVSLLEILAVPNGLSTSQRYSAKNKIQAKHIDFLLCEKESFRPLLVIELDGSSHENPRRILRDNFLKDALASAGLPFLPMPRSSRYDEVELSNRIHECLHVNSTT